MKINVFPAILLAIVAIAISYLAYYIAHSNSDANDIVVGIGTGLSIQLSLGCVMAITLENGKQNVNLRAWGIAAFILMASVNFCFAALGVSMPYYVIVLALLLVIHLWVVWKLATINNV